MNEAIDHAKTTMEDRGAVTEVAAVSEGRWPRTRVSVESRAVGSAVGRSQHESSKPSYPRRVAERLRQERVKPQPAVIVTSLEPTRSRFLTASRLPA